MTKKQKRAYHAAYMRAYSKTPKGRVRVKAFEDSAQRQAWRRTYMKAYRKRNRNKLLAQMKAYRSTPKYKVYARAYCRHQNRGLRSRPTLHFPEPVSSGQRAGSRNSSL